jgi:plasmid stabilization system protein ParE
MPFKEVRLHEEALAEAQAAYRWYFAQDPVAAEAFIDELDYTSCWAAVCGAW